MSRVDQLIQGNIPLDVFRCYCGESSYLEIMHDAEDDQFYIYITLSPTRLKERLRLAWKALRGIEFLASNEVIIDGSDIEKVAAALSPQPQLKQAEGTLAKGEGENTSA